MNADCNSSRANYSPQVRITGLVLDFRVRDAGTQVLVANGSQRTANGPLTDPLTANGRMPVRPLTVNGPGRGAGTKRAFKTAVDRYSPFYAEFSFPADNSVTWLLKWA